MRSLSIAAALFVTGVALAALPEVGKPAPDFNVPATSVKTVLPDAKGDKLSLADLRGKNVVLFFYPKALTKGCTIESCGFRDLAKEFAAADTVLIGASNDTVDLQQKFTDKEKLTYPLLADTEKKVATAYGAQGAKVPMRYTYVIDKKGVLRKVYTKVMPAKHPQEVLDYIKENLK